MEKVKIEAEAEAKRRASITEKTQVKGKKGKGGKHVSRIEYDTGHPGDNSTTPRPELNYGNMQEKK